jgi:hypothetical protein
MVNYKCNRCGFISIRRGRFIKHLNRKFICKPLIEDISIKEIYNIYFKKDNNTNNSLCKPASANVSQHVSQRQPKRQPTSANVSQQTQNEYFCRYCNRSFSRRQSKWKHETNRCTFKLNSDSEVIENEIREKLLEELAESGQLVKADQQLIKSGKINIDKSLNNNIGAINNITISLNSYDNTDKSYIKNTDILTCIKKGNMGIPHMIHLLHCNKYKPENHNVCLNNIKSSYIGVYNGRKWDYEMQFELIDMMAEDCINMIEDRIAEWDDEFYKKHKSIIDKFPHFQYKYYDSKYVKKRVHEEAKLKLFNNRDLIMNTRNKLLEINS